MNTIACPCGQTLRVGDVPAGARIRCRNCGRIHDASAATSAPSQSQSQSPDAPADAGQSSRSGTKRRKKRFVRTDPGSFIAPQPRRWSMPAMSWALGAGWRSALLSPAGVLVAGYALTMLAFWVLLAWKGDVNGPGMVLLFAPRWWCMLPWAVLVPLALLSNRRLAVVALAGVAITLFGVGQFELPDVAPETPGRRALRVVTYNTDRSAALAYRIREDLQAWDADVVLLQGCKTMVGDTLLSIPGITVHRTPEFCLATRYPLESVDTMPRVAEPGVAALGRFNNAIRYNIRVSNTVVPVYSIHLESPRDALGAARHLDFGGLAGDMARRSLDSRLTSRWVSRADTAFVAAGDFNLPYGSAILETDWGDLTNAFSHAGTGFGYTMFAGHYAVRIDHVLVPPALVVSAVKLLRGYPSDHQPVVVDLAWRP